MNRNKRGEMPEISRKMYKDVKKYDRQQFTAFCMDLYKYGKKQQKHAFVVLCSLIRYFKLFLP